MRRFDFLRDGVKVGEGVERDGAIWWWNPLDSKYHPPKFASDMREGDVEISFVDPPASDPKPAGKMPSIAEWIDERVLQEGGPYSRAGQVGQRLEMLIEYLDGCRIDRLARVTGE